jgi:hypothetical protein
LLERLIGLDVRVEGPFPDGRTILVVDHFQGPAFIGACETGDVDQTVTPSRITGPDKGEGSISWSSDDMASYNYEQ